MTKARLLRALLIIAALPSIVLQKPHPHFAQTGMSALHFAQSAPSFHAEFLPPIPGDFVHGATMLELPNGDLAAAWYGGTDEIMPDVKIYLSIYHQHRQTWSIPIAIESAQHAKTSLGMVKSIGNPVLYHDRNGYKLFFVAVVTGGWSGGTICMESSPDLVHWSPPVHVVSSPLFDLGMLVRAAPVPFDDGTIALPIYHQLNAKWSAIARVDSEGHVLDIARIADLRPLLQPWLVPTSATEAYAFLRYSHPHKPFAVTMSRTRDAGAHWSDVLPTPLVHRDSQVSSVLLSDNSLLVFYNGSAWDRRDLSVARTMDGGVHWSWPYHIEHDTTGNDIVRREYSYPYVYRTRDGNIHLLYTWQRTRIRHLTFNEAWVRANPTLAVPR
ncbi:MAG TPA: sialidase family protein [Thermoanaerobaculia bacterium]|jgi:predicted neuraminidase|nr:sialidase family protein [Thermoanaerobaculia bacterium]